MTSVDRLNGALSSLAIKAPVHLATTANITLSALQAIDGVTTVSGDRVLVKDQTTASENGIYVADTSTWNRAPDFDGNSDTTQGTLVFVAAGNTLAGKVYQLTTASAVIGTSSLSFSQTLFSGLSGVTFTQAGTGAVARDAQDKMREVERSPEDYGAAAAYSAAVDDRTFVQAAVDACFAAGGGTVILNRIYALNSFSSGYYTVKPKSGVAVRGKGFNTGFKFANNLRSATQGLSVLYDHDNALSDIIYEDFKVDWNGVNNLQPNPETVTSNVNRLGGAAGCKNVHIRNVWFKDSGAHHHVFLSDLNVANANGNCSVIGCIFQNAGKAIAGNTFITDHTSIYMDVADSVVSGNMFLMDNLDDTVATAIETHKSNIQVGGNAVYGYANAVNVGAQVANVVGVPITGNTFRSCIRGVVLWTGTAFTLKGVKIIGNTISCRENASVNANGILAVDTTMASSANGRQLFISGNTIELESQASLGTQTVGIHLWRWDDVTIEGNGISHWVSEGIVLQAETAARKLHRIQIANNRFRGCAVTTTGAQKRVIACNADATPGTDDIDYLEIKNNQIVCDAPAGTVASWGIQLNGGRFPHAWIYDNTITGAAISPIDKIAATADAFLVRGQGDVDPAYLIRAAKGSEWYDSLNGRFNRAVLGTNDYDTWRSESFSTAMPSTGRYSAGDKVWLTTPTSAIAGWLRITTSTSTTGAHVLNTDWSEMEL